MTKPKCGLILMTALPPTVGHLSLIRFARQYLGSGVPLFVVVSSRSFYEPIAGIDRISSLENDEPGPVYLLHEDDDAPQNPSESPTDAEFWDYWRNVIINHVDNKSKYKGWRPTHIFGSEPYCVKIAEMFGAEFVPFDMKRETVSVKATNVRMNIHQGWEDIIPSMRNKLRKTVTLFGAESCGKTTNSRRLTSWDYVDATWVPEYARQYLETVGPEVTAEKMNTIARGQYALQRTVREMDNTRPTIVQDTDLLSTIGYSLLYQKYVPDEMVKYFQQTKSDLYVLMSTYSYPLVPDILRYGGDVRESDDQFWIDLLNQYGCNYIIFDQTGKTPGSLDTMVKVAEAINQLQQPLRTALENFKRT